MKYYKAQYEQEVFGGTNSDGEGYYEYLTTPVIIPATSLVIAEIIATSMGAKNVEEIIPTLPAIEQHVECTCTEEQRIQNRSRGHSRGCKVFELSLQIEIKGT